MRYASNLSNRPTSPFISSRHVPQVSFARARKVSRKAIIRTLIIIGSRTYVAFVARPDVT